MKPMTIHLEELTSDALIQNAEQDRRLWRSDKVGCSKRIAIHFRSICYELADYPKYLLRYYRSETIYRCLLFLMFAGNLRREGLMAFLYSKFKGLKKPNARIEGRGGED